MDLSKFMFWKKAPVTSVKEAGNASGQITQANVQNFVVKAVGQVEGQANNFVAPETDLSEIKEAVGADSYIKLAVSKYSQLIFKAGYNIVGQNDAAVEYLSGRLRMMSFMTDTPMDILFQQVAEDLVTYSNAFLIKSRIDMTNIGGLQAQGLYDPKPVGGYYRVDPSTMQIKRDKNGTIKQYQQSVGSDNKSYKNTDVIHFYIDKPGGAAFGVPRIQSALEDVKLLRKIEGNVLRLVYRHASPLMQMKIGLPEAGFMATDKEIKEARSEVEKLSDDGLLITNERTSFDTVGAKGTALDVSKYLAYFEARVFAALSLSSAMVGRGGAKQDADSMEEQVHDTVKYIQRTIATFIREKIFTELLLEGGYNPFQNEQDIVDFQFNEINLETRVKMETHALNQFQGNAIPFEEMRQLIGKRADNVDESRLFANMITLKNDLSLINAKVGSEGTGSASANAGTSGPDSKKTGENKQVKSTVRPQNQHGTTSMKIKESMNIAEKDSKTDKHIREYEKKFKEVYKKYSSMRNDIAEDKTKLEIVMPLARDSIRDWIHKYIEEEEEKGFRKALKDLNKKNGAQYDISSSVIINKTEKILTQMFVDIKTKLKEATSQAEIEAVFDAMSYRLRFLCEQITVKAYWYGYVKCCAKLNIPTVYVDFGKSSDKKDHKKYINPKSFSLDDIPAFNAYCSCKVKVKGR